MGVEITPRTKYLRTLLSEYSRIVRPPHLHRGRR